MSTVEALVGRKRSDVRRYYLAAARRWKGLTETRKARVGLAERLVQEQVSFFEKECGGVVLGQEIMAVVSVGHLYSTAQGFGKRLALAAEIVSAIRLSQCSLEVKGAMEEAVKMYRELAEYLRKQENGS